MSSQGSRYKMYPELKDQLPRTINYARLSTEKNPEYRLITPRQVEFRTAISTQRQREELRRRDEPSSMSPRQLRM